MRGNLCVSVHVAECTVSDDGDEQVARTVARMESACGAVAAGRAGSARDRGEKGKNVLSPPMFIFQRMAPSMKRRAERWEEGSAVGVSSNKRVRSFTFPSPRTRTRTRTSPCERSRRTRSTSVSFHPPSPVSQSNVFMPPNVCNLINFPTETASPRAKRSILRPSLLLSPQPGSLSEEPQVPEESRDNAGDLCSVTKSRPPVSSLWPQGPRSEEDVSTSDRIEFVFGENMSARVLSPQKTVISESESDCSSSESDFSESSHKEGAWSTLRESAAAHMASSRGSRPLRRVQLFTGEERESNVVQLTCRLFVLGKGTHSWGERGRGVLRLNDLASGPKGGLQSRIVMRHQGSLKVMLNTKLWPHTHLCRPGRRNLQLTASDAESRAVRVFLVQAGARDVARLYVALHHRLVALRCEGAGLEDEGAGPGGPGAWAREGHCNSEDEEEEEDDEEEEEEEERQRQRRERDERLLGTRLRPGEDG